jgi:hypothetical protein
MEVVNAGSDASSRKRDSKTGPKKGNVAVTPPFLERVPYTRSHNASKNSGKILRKCMLVHR